MSFRTVIPFKPRNPKTRLSQIMSKEEREVFALCMLKDVLDAIPEGCTHRIVLTTESGFECEGAEIVAIDAGLNDALNRFFEGTRDNLLLVMADLPLADRNSLGSMTSTGADIAIAPGRGGGTNALFLKDPSRFRADFYGMSFLKHMNIASAFGCSVQVIDSFRLHTDVDEVSDLVEVLIHGRGRSRKFLESLGFSLVAEKGRVGVSRDPHE